MVSSFKLSKPATEEINFAALSGFKAFTLITFKFNYSYVSILRRTPNFKFTLKQLRRNGIRQIQSDSHSFVLNAQLILPNKSFGLRASQPVAQSRLQVRGMVSPPYPPCPTPLLLQAKANNSKPHRASLIRHRASNTCMTDSRQVALKR